MRVLLGLTFLTISLALINCEGMRHAEGIAVDKVSNLPLDSVLCNVLSGNQKALTDSTGTFDVSNRLSGCMFGCKDIRVEFSKKGYKTIALTNPKLDVVVTLEK